jgi:ERCC4-related helicase
MVDKFIVVPTGAKTVSELKFIVRKGRTPTFDYGAVVTVLNSGKAYVLDATVKEQTARSAMKKIKEKLNKGLTVKVRKLEGTGHNITVNGKEVVLYQLVFEPVKV